MTPTAAAAPAAARAAAAGRRSAPHGSEARPDQQRDQRRRDVEDVDVDMAVLDHVERAASGRTSETSARTTAAATGRRCRSCRTRRGKYPAAASASSRLPMNSRNCVTSGWANDEAVYCMRGVGYRKPQPHTGARRRRREQARTAPGPERGGQRDQDTRNRHDAVSDAQPARADAAPSRTIAGSSAVSTLAHERRPLPAPAKPMATQSSASTAIAASIGQAASCAVSASAAARRAEKHDAERLGKTGRGEPADQPHRDDRDQPGRRGARRRIARGRQSPA